MEIWGLGPAHGRGSRRKGSARGIGVAAVLALTTALAACGGAPQAGRLQPEQRGGAAPGAPVSAPELKKLDGLSDKDVQRVLGEPDFRREEPPAEIWQYRSAECVLDLYLYDDSGQYRVAYAETHDRGFTRVSQTSCYSRLVSDRNQIRQGRL
ncbi:MAG TPA: hypothetical protein VMU06_19330 [Stellaceae bacterium]|nr:hypothetical protein [Stellaceae bacterium]